MEKIVGSNQGEVSNEWKGVKANTQLPGVENRGGAESGVSDTAGRGAVAANYASPTGNNGINGTYEDANRAAQFKNPNVKDNPGEFGGNQYE